MWKKVGEAAVIGSLLVILLIAPAYALLFGDRERSEVNEDRIEELEERVERLETKVEILTERGYGR